jgi:hypothetical protein
MSFVRSRLMLVAVVLAVPAIQVGACAQKDRTYEPDDGDEEGGTAGTKPTTGGSSTKGGETGEGGTGNQGQAGDGVIITGGSDGEAGSPPVDPNCVPTGDEECSDGVDNDCDGETDCLVLRDEFPTENGAASGADVRYTFTRPHETATFECRTAHGGTLPASAEWGECGAVSGGEVQVFTDSVSRDPTKDGMWTTDVRLSFPDGTASARYRRQVYIHSSLHGVARCNLGVTDAALFAAATPNLNDEGAFDVTTIRNPFVSIDFDPPVNTTTNYNVKATDGTINLRTLRRSFAFNANNHYMVVKRSYTSRLSDMACTAVEKRTHVKGGSWVFAGNMAYQRCSALVMNKKGAGYCLSVAGGKITSAEYIRADGGNLVPNPPYSPKADNFAWRKLRATKGAGIIANFSPKCDDVGCGDTTKIFLPDAALFRYWTE